MAPISKFISFLFLTTLSLSLQTNARDSQFFSKVTYNNNNKVNEVPQNKEASAVNKPGEQQPVFMAENENSYGLYGHESGLHPPMDDNYKPYKTTTDQEDNNNNNFYNFQKDADSTTNYPSEISDTRLTGTSFNNNNKESYDTKYTGEQRFNSMENQYDNKFNYNKDANNYETKLTGEGYNSMENQNNNNKYNYNNNEKYYFNNNNDRYSSFKNKAATNNYNSERLGMSDTRAMEGGKYFYDVNSDKYKYNPTTIYDQGSSKGVINSENRGYFGNNKNSMEGNYQNQEEFQNDQQEFEP